MKIVIAHLSDIHFKSHHNQIQEREEKIASAIAARARLAEGCFIVVSGDVAFSGRVDEYQVATRFFTRIFDILTREIDGCCFNVVMVPGNHDCDFTMQNAVRTLMLSSGEQILQELNEHDDSIVAALTGVQNNFFSFLAELEMALQPARTETADVPTVGYERLHYKREFTIKGKNFRFDCYNSAWTSQLHEQQAQLVFPVLAWDIDSGKADLNVSTFHHPTRWLESNNARNFRSAIEPRSDLILTGHEHAADHYLKQNAFSLSSNIYLEAPALQSSEENGFNLIEMDLNERVRRHTEYKWRNGMYEPSNTTEWISFERSQALRPIVFENNPTFRAELTDAGANMNHPSGHNLTLNDIFVYPDLEVLNLERKNDSTSPVPIIDSDRVFQHVSANPYLLLTSPAVNGKTALARFLYMEFQKQDLVPVLVHGSDLHRHQAEDLERLIDQKVAEQYSRETVEKYRQLNAARRVLIIDDFQRATRLNRRGKNAILEAAGKMFGRIIVFANDLFRFEELTEETDEQSVLFTFSQASLIPFAQLLRRRLISKWVKFGQEFRGDEEELEHRIDELANTVTTLIGRKMVPSYPFFVLSMLQLLETNTNLNTAPSTFGYFYEAFILTGLSKHKSQAIPMDVFISYVPLIAYQMFKLKKHSLSQDDIDQVTNMYFVERGIQFKREAMMRNLEEAKIIFQDTSGSYRFNYKYGYYYFVAKYISQKLYTAGSQELMRQHIIRMTSNLYVEDYANIVLFLVYLTQDEGTIGQILTTAKGLYPEYAPSKFEADVEFANKMKLEPLSPRLVDGDPSTNKEEFLRRADELERRFDDDDETEDDLRLEREMNDMLRLNVAMKTLQIMGQVLRNFPGGLLRSQKIDLLDESYNLGLRTTGMMFMIMEELNVPIREKLVDLVPELGEAVGEERARKTDRVFFLLFAMVAYSMVRRISQAVGSQHLIGTYNDELILDKVTTARKLIDVSIKMDHFRPFPEKPIIELAVDVKENKLALSVLRQMVRDHFHLTNESRKVRQKVCDKVGIPFQDPRMIEQKSKVS